MNKMTNKGTTQVSQKVSISLDNLNSVFIIHSVSIAFAIITQISMIWLRKKHLYPFNFFMSKQDKSRDDEKVQKDSDQSSISSNFKNDDYKDSSETPSISNPNNKINVNNKDLIKKIQTTKRRTKSSKINSNKKFMNISNNETKIAWKL